MRISSFKDYQKRAHCPRPPLSAYLEDYLTPAQRELTERHIDGCARCAAQLAEMRQAMEQVGQLGQVTVPPEVITAALAEVDPLAALSRTAPSPAAAEPAFEAPPLLWEHGMWRPAIAPTQGIDETWAQAAPASAEEPVPAAAQVAEPWTPVVEHAETPPLPSGEAPAPPPALVFAERDAAPAPEGPADVPPVPVFADQMRRPPTIDPPPTERARGPALWPARLAAVAAAGLVLVAGVIWSGRGSQQATVAPPQPTSSVAEITAAPKASPTPAPTPTATPTPLPPAPVGLRAIRIKDNGAVTQNGVFNPKVYEVVLDLTTSDQKPPAFTANVSGNVITVTIPGLNPSGVAAFQAPASAPIVSVVPGEGIVTITMRTPLPYNTWSLDTMPRVVVDLTRP